MTAPIGKTLATAVFALTVAATALAQWSEPASDEIFVRGGWLFDGVSDARRQNTGIVIRDGKFAEVDADLQEQVLAAANLLIEVDKLADLFVARGNPLEDIKTARNVKLVIKAGVVYDPETLLRSAEHKTGPSGPDDHADWELTIEPLREN